MATPEHVANNSGLNRYGAPIRQAPLTVENGTKPKTTDNGSQTQSQEKLGGVFWWLMLGLMGFSDIGTALCNILVTVGLSLTATVVGSIIGIPLAVLGYGASLLISLNAFMFSMGYYWTNKVPLLEARKLATLGVSVIIKGIPYGNLLPTLTISFVVVTLMENAKRGSGIIGAVAKKVVAKAGPVGAIAGNVLSKA